MAAEPNIDLIKSLAPGQAEVVKIGDRVNYVIKVRNMGPVAAVNQKVQDNFTVASNGGLALVPSSLWTENNGIATYNDLIDIPANGNVQLEISFTITANAESVIRNLAVVCDNSGEDCDPVTPPSCDDADEAGNPEGCAEVELERYDLALRKGVSNSTSGPFNIGDNVTFDIRVFNQGTLDSGEVEITDYIPEGLSLTDSAWTQSGDKAMRTISNISANSSVLVTISFVIDVDAPMEIENFAEISDDSGNDCDSTPDVSNGNESGETTGISDDSIGSDCEDG